VTYLALRLLGYNVLNYDASWQEWGNDPAVPIFKR
jgi:thiosulfate/3-mercaptopyruvate sulfurtransferase